MVQEAEELRHVPAPVLPSEAEVQAHNVSHLLEQIPTISVDYGLFEQPENGAHDTVPVLIVRDRKSERILTSNKEPSFVAFCADKIR